MANVCCFTGKIKGSKKEVDKIIEIMELSSVVPDLILFETNYFNNVTDFAYYVESEEDNEKVVLFNGTTRHNIESAFLLHSEPKLHSDNKFLTVTGLNHLLKELTTVKIEIISTETGNDFTEKVYNTDHFAYVEVSSLQDAEWLDNTGNQNSGLEDGYEPIFTI